MGYFGPPHTHPYPWAIQGESNLKVQMGFPYMVSYWSLKYGLTRLFTKYKPSIFEWAWIWTSLKVISKVQLDFLSDSNHMSPSHRSAVI